MIILLITISLRQCSHLCKFYQRSCPSPPSPLSIGNQCQCVISSRSVYTNPKWTQSNSLYTSTRRRITPASTICTNDRGCASLLFSPSHTSSLSLSLSLSLSRARTPFLFLLSLSVSPSAFHFLFYFLPPSLASPLFQLFFITHFRLFYLILGKMY
jgi:hypothetical protein